MSTGRSRITLARRVLRWSLVATVFAVVGFAPSASAAPYQANTTEYYSDATYTVQIGTKWINCYNPYIVIEGTTSSFRIVTWHEVC